MAESQAVVPDPSVFRTLFGALPGDPLSEDRPLTVRRAPGASPVPTWRVTVGRAQDGVVEQDGIVEQDWAVKLYRREAPARGQAELLGWLRAAGFPVAAAHFRRHGETFALITEWLAHGTLAEALTHSPQDAQRWGVALGRCHAALHALPVPEGVRAALPVLAVPGLSPQDLSPHHPALLHLDFHPLNVLVAWDGAGTPRVAAVLDWENVRLGPPRADVARTLSLLSVDPGVLALPAWARVALRGLRRGYRAGYGETGDLGAALAWAGHFLQRDLAGRCAPEDLAPVRRWTRLWTRRAGLSSAPQGGLL